MTELVTLKTLAERIKVSRSALRRHCIANDIEMEYVRHVAPGSRGQFTLAIDRGNVPAIAAHYFRRKNTG